MPVQIALENHAQRFVEVATPYAPYMVVLSEPSLCLLGGHGPAVFLVFSAKHRYAKQVMTVCLQSAVKKKQHHGPVARKVFEHMTVYDEIIVVRREVFRPRA